MLSSSLSAGTRNENMAGSRDPCSWTAVRTETGSGGATGDWNDGPRKVRSVGRAEESHEGRDLVGRGEAARRDPLRQVPPRGFGILAAHRVPMAPGRKDR